MKISNSHGLSAGILEVRPGRSIDTEQVRISLRTSSVYSGASANLWLRKRGGQIKYRPLMGPGSHTRFRTGKNIFRVIGSWDGLDYECLLQLSEKSPSWKWSVDILNNSVKIRCLI